MLKEAKKKHKETIEENFAANNSRKMWDTMRRITNMTPAQKCLSTINDLQKATELNDF